MATGYGIYGGVGLPTPSQDPAQGGQAPIQSLDTGSMGGGQMYAGPTNYNPGSPTGNKATYGGQLGPAGSTSASGFYGLGGTAKGQYYLPENANKDLYSTTLDPFQMSAQLGGGQIRNEDIAALRQASNNSMDPFYSQIAQYGINATPYVNDFRNSGTNNAAAFFQQASRNGAYQGVNYDVDPSFGLVGSIGELNFDVHRKDPRLDVGAYYQAIEGYIPQSRLNQDLGNRISQTGMNRDPRSMNYPGQYDPSQGAYRGTSSLRGGISNLYI